VNGGSLGGGLGQFAARNTIFVPADKLSELGASKEHHFKEWIRTVGAFYFVWMDKSALRRGMFEHDWGGIYCPHRVCDITARILKFEDSSFIH
jgi:hypothetical protein